MKPWDILPMLCERIVRAMGWSPIGKSIEVLIEEAANAALVGKSMRGRIVAIDAAGCATTEVSDQPSLRLCPRHVGYGMYFLPLGRIAVYVESDGKSTGAFASGRAALLRL